MDDAQDGAPRRRIIRSRRAFSGALSNSTVSEGVGNVVEEDADLNSMVEEATAARTPVVPAAPIPREDAVLGAHSVQDEEYTPQGRMQQVRRRGSEYEREYRLQLLHRLLMRNVPIDEIAAQLQLSVSQVLKDRSELRERLREESRRMDIDFIVGHNKGFYEEVAAMGLRAASQNSAPLPMRLAAMRTALAAQNDGHRFMQAAGVYDVLRYKRAATDGEASDIQRLMSMTRELLEGVDNPLAESSGGDSASDEDVIL